MTHSTHSDPCDLLLFACWLAAEAALRLLAAAVALVLTLAGWSPRRPSCPGSALALPAPEPAAPALAGLPVRELRRLARTAGLPGSLTRSGRRADLLAALAAA